MCEDFSRIEAAVYAVGGWSDGYSNAIPRLVEGVAPGRAKGLIGPWSHAFPYDGCPEPSITRPVITVSFSTSTLAGSVCVCFGAEHIISFPTRSGPPPGSRIRSNFRRSS